MSRTSFTSALFHLWIISSPFWPFIAISQLLKKSANSFIFFFAHFKTLFNFFDLLMTAVSSVSVVFAVVAPDRIALLPAAASGFQAPVSRRDDLAPAVG